MSDLHDEILDNFCLWTVTEFESESRCVKIQMKLLQNITSPLSTPLQQNDQFSLSAMGDAHFLEVEKNKLSYSSALGYLLSPMLKKTIILCFFYLEKIKTCGLW